MKRFLISCLVLLSGLGPGFATQPRAQSLMDRPDPVPAILRTEGILHHPPPAASEPLSPETKSYSPNVNFEPYSRSWTATRTSSPPLINLKKFMALITVNQPGKLEAVPEGLKIGSGLTWSLPITSGFSTFATFTPAYRNFGAPEAVLTMVTTGFQVPLVKGTPGSGDLSLKFSTSIDQQFRPTFFFSLATPFRWINPDSPGQNQPSGGSRGAY